MDLQQISKPDEGVARANNTVNPELPENVTPEPRNDEEMHMELIAHDPALIEAYLAVSDDYGERLGDTELEAEVINSCRHYAALKPKDIREPDEVLRQLRGLSNRYLRKVNRMENISIGISTKYRIREGMLFNIQKVIVTKVIKQQKWIDYFKEHFDESHLRSVQDYMRLARIPNVIRYAIFGKEQLLEIARRIGKPDGDDPIGDFLKNQGIEFDPEAELDVAELKMKTDVAINHQRLLDEDLGEIGPEKVDAFVRTGNEIEKRHIRELKMVKQANGDVARFMDILIDTGGKFEPVPTPERKAENYKKTFERFLDQTASALHDAEYLQHIDQDLFRRLKEKILELEQKITNNN